MFGLNTRGGDIVVTVMAPLDLPLPTAPLDDNDGLLLDAVLLVPFGGVLICCEDERRVMLLCKPPTEPPATLSRVMLR